MVLKTAEAHNHSDLPRPQCGWRWCGTNGRLRKLSGRINISAGRDNDEFEQFEQELWQLDAESTTSISCSTHKNDWSTLWPLLSLSSYSSAAVLLVLR